MMWEWLAVVGLLLGIAVGGLGAHGQDNNPY